MGAGPCGFTLPTLTRTMERPENRQSNYRITLLRVQDIVGDLCIAARGDRR
jgi:hypothetical protein